MSAILKTSALIDVTELVEGAREAGLAPEVCDKLSTLDRLYIEMEVSKEGTIENIVIESITKLVTLKKRDGII